MLKCPSPISLGPRTKGSKSSCQVRNSPQFVSFSDTEANNNQDFNHERVWLACTSLRLARTCLQDAYNYALSRQTFGTALINHQAIRSKFSVLGGSILPAHAFMESLVAHSLSNSDPQIGGLIALLKVMAGKALEQAAREAQQIMGGLGYSRTGKGARVEQISRDVRVLVVGGGSEEILSDLAFRQEERDLVSITRSTKSKL
jgi:alkylation response protein AidB-like acyl-CoA dehydrogenase